jgi:hypothetical protein
MKNRDEDMCLFNKIQAFLKVFSNISTDSAS